MTKTWAMHLLRAIDEDEVATATDESSDSDPAHGPWDLAPNAVADSVITAALLGYPTDQDADAILNTPGALDRLARRWAAASPRPTLVERAATNPALRRLLTAVEISAISVAGRQAQRLRPLQNSDFALAAADLASVRQEETWAGGRVIRQRLQDGSTAVTAEYTRTHPTAWEQGEDPCVVSLVAPTDEAKPLLLLMMIPDPEETEPAPGMIPLVGQAVVGAAAAIGELQITGPVQLSALTQAELASVPDSVAWSRGAWNTAWRRAAQAAGKGTPLYDAVLWGTRHV